ncbi:MAG: DUF1549 domain-containing protein [Chthoniobacteraceae bacterium]|jgi:hypothetical protein
MKIGIKFFLPLLALPFLLAAAGPGAPARPAAAPSPAPIVAVPALRLDRPMSFKNDVMPVLTKAGCNTGACHGSARGRDGFHLSLFGFDPDGDYDRITREMGARRIDLAMPEESLLLLKATGSVPHTGGKRFDKSSEFYKAVYQWLAAGAPHDPPNVPGVASVEIHPTEMILEGENVARPLQVLARYSDGTVRDVTSLAVFNTNNEASAKVSPAGIVSSGDRGEAFVMARFDTTTVGTSVIVVPKGLQFTFPKVEERNYVDQLIDDKLKKLRIAPSGLCTDEEFLRRASIDITGLLPTVEEHNRFVANPDPNKRTKLVDELLARPEFADIWVMKWAELLQIRSGGDIAPKSALVYYDWLHDQIEEGVPINEIVRQLVGSTGGTFGNPASGFYQFETDPLKLAEDTAQAFLGVQIKCAQCHNHPFDQWTMNDYRGFVAFFTQIARKKGEDPRETIVYDRQQGDSVNPVTNRVVLPKFLGGAQPALATGEDRRQLLADWLASPDNPWFPKHVANIVWDQFFGRGIVQPVDDVRVSNPPVNGPLLQALAEHLVDYRYDIRPLIHDICLSRTYQESSQPNATNAQDDRNFAHSGVRRLRAEVMLDCISEATGTRDKYRGLPLGGHAVQIADGATTSFFLRTFGRSPRDTPSASAISVEPDLSQALELINGDTVQNKIVGGGVVRKMIAAKMDDQTILANLYLRTLGRAPTPDELKTLTPLLADPTTRQSKLEDIFWALLNSKEFMFNH